MGKHKYTRAFTRLVRRIFKLLKTITVKSYQWLLRSFFVSSRRQRQGGFVLPTTVMVLLVVSLVVAALVFRTFSRTSQVITQRQQQVIYNAATPTIDRAKAKLEYLFRQDTRLPAGVPSDSLIESALEPPTAVGGIVPPDQYTLPGETPLNFTDPLGRRGIGWYFTDDKTGNIIAYSITFKTQAAKTNAPNPPVTEIVNFNEENEADKARFHVVRNGPINTYKSRRGCNFTGVQLASNERDWQPLNAATLSKTFQVDAVVIQNGDKANRSVTTLEFQQDRQADKGNKWGAYFRYDLENFNGPAFNWNGAMRSDGNMFLGPFGTFKAYLISSATSCVNTGPEASKITVNEVKDTTGTTTFLGQIVASRLNLQQFDGGSKIDLSDANGKLTGTRDFNKDTDSVTPPPQPSDIALDPEALFTQEQFQARGSDPTNVSLRATGWGNSDFVKSKRIFNEATKVPLLDDTYRADNRYGPSPRQIPPGQKVGNPITTADPRFVELIRETPPDPRSPEALGLDGYWERRATRGGLRVIVGQRLELGNFLAAPTSPVTAAGLRREHEFLQRRTLRDNLAAVQGMAVYHYNYDGTPTGTFPVACMATTVHPGTADTLRRGATFDTININGTATLVTDFFNGRGTNGWEFNPPAASQAAFATAIAPTAPLGRALRNLANYAGDPNGAFPAVQEPSGNIVHPYPAMTQAGDFSNLRRALQLLDGGTPYANLSIADRSFIESAACSLGMLAYNVKHLTTYDYTNPANTADLTALNAALGGVTPPGTPTPEAYIAGLPDANRPLARLLLTRERVARDRIRGGTGYTCGLTAVTGQPNLARLCPPAAGDAVQYDSLSYIFPTTAQAETRPDTYITSTAVNPPGVPDRYKAIPNADLATIEIIPRVPIDWRTPRTDVTSLASTVPGAPASLPNSNQPNLNNLIAYNATPSGGTPQYYQVAFKDSALFNGREMMSVRALDIDLDLLRRTTVPGGDTWLPTNPNDGTPPAPASGVVYTFREDAVREDAIARPAAATMNASPSVNGVASPLTDPTITSANGITTKPVDYIPDPDRRSHGFRLKNGVRLDRGTPGTPSYTAGMSFISDNAVYIQGDFNLHSTDGTTSTTSLLEEFKDFKLNDDPTWSKFYDRKDVEPRFAAIGDSAADDKDKWRPTEVLGDSVTVLSNNFCDGSIEDGIIYAGFNPTNPGVGGVLPALNLPDSYGCNAAARFTSYLNQNRPSVRIDSPLLPAGRRAASVGAAFWAREISPDPNAPIQISSNGKPFYAVSGTPTEYDLLAVGAPTPQTYLRFQDPDTLCGVNSNRKCVSTASETRVNSMIIQGINPSRGGQSYGGFHNFPRFIENWDTRNLFMAGSFIQLKFSTYATAPYDQDAWEPASTPISSGGTHEYIWYFLPPNRRWGYDVALQYQTGGPVARRFATPGITRSEVYRELPIDDPYIKNLRCAKKGDGTRIDAAVNDTFCS